MDKFLYAANAMNVTNAVAVPLVVLESVVEQPICLIATMKQHGRKVYTDEKHHIYEHP